VDRDYNPLVWDQELAQCHLPLHPRNWVVDQAMGLQDADQTQLVVATGEVAEAAFVLVVVACWDMPVTDLLVTMLA
jgi:hypothetical protein